MEELLQSKIPGVLHRRKKTIIQGLTAAQREQSKKLKEEVIQKHQTRFKRQAEIVKEIDDASYQEEDLEELVQLERRITESELADEDTIQEDGEEALQNNGGLVSDDEEEDDLGFNLDTDSSDLYLSGEQDHDSDSDYEFEL